MRATVIALAVLVTLSLAEPIAAQTEMVEVPAICTEFMMSRSIFIGHDCGEWASIMIVGNIVIRKPWSQATSASRAARIRANREGGTAPAEEPARAPKPKRTPRPRQTPEPATDGATMFGVDISSGNPDELDCADFRYQEDAQELFDAQGWSATNDPYNLDSRGEDDGVPCEQNPPRP